MDYNDLSDRDLATRVSDVSVHVPAFAGQRTTTPDPDLVTFVRALARVTAARDLRASCQGRTA